MFSHRGRKRLGHLGEKRMEQIWNHQANQITATSDKAAGSKVGLVIQFLNALQDTFPGFFRNIGMVPEDL